MDDLMIVQVVHALCDLLCPAGHSFGGYLVSVLDEIEERPVRAELHDDAEHRRGGAHTSAQCRCAGCLELCGQGNNCMKQITYIYIHKFQNYN